MARDGIAKITKTLRNIRVQKAWAPSGRWLHESRLHNQRVKLHEGSAASTEVRGDRGTKEELAREVEDPFCWVPDYRTGIYYPRGHERVMDDIPEGAASFGDTTFWLRNNIDGVDKPDHPVYKIK